MMRDVLNIIRGCVILSMVDAISNSALSRSALLRSLPAWIGAGSVFLSPRAGLTDSSTMLPQVTQTAFLDVSIQMSPESTEVKRIAIGLFGDEAPVATRVFTALIAGTLDVPCSPEKDTSTSLQREALTKRGVMRACLANEDIPVGYSGSQIWRIVQGRRIDFGQVQGKFALREAPTTPLSEGLRLQHDRPGLISVPKGGGVFDFTITLAPAPELDSTNVVIGQVLPDLSSENGLQFLGNFPVVNYVGQGMGGSSSRSKQCFYGSTEKFCSQLKPIKKMTLRTTLRPNTSATQSKV